MAKFKIFKTNTTDGPRFGIGMFDRGEMLKGAFLGEFKTKKGAERKLKRLNLSR